MKKLSSFEQKQETKRKELVSAEDEFDNAILKEGKYPCLGKLSFLILYSVLDKSLTKYRIKIKILKTYKSMFLVFILRN